MSDWYKISNEDDVASPAMLVYPDRIKENIRRMVVGAGGAEHLRPHVKTHKMPQIIAMKLEAGITKFKVATIAEAEMTAAAGGKDILLAHQPVGPGERRFAELVKEFPQTRFATIADNVRHSRRTQSRGAGCGSDAGDLCGSQCGHEPHWRGAGR